MKRSLSLWRNLAISERAASAVEFALLAPVFLALMFGIVSVGIHMQNYNAVRSLASDAARFAAVEYQKNNTVSETTLENNFQSMGVSAPYFLQSDRLTVAVSEVTSRVPGAREFDLDISYALPEIAGGIALDGFTMNYSRPIFVLSS